MWQFRIRILVNYIKLQSQNYLFAIWLKHCDFVELVRKQQYAKDSNLTYLINADCQFYNSHNSLTIAIDI